MSSKIDLEASSEILRIASKYIIYSVLSIAIGSVGIVYSILALLVYGEFAIEFAIIGGFFIGIAFLVIGIFLTFWGLYWMRSEGKRLKKRLEMSQNH